MSGIPQCPSFSDQVTLHNPRSQHKLIFMQQRVILSDTMHFHDPHPVHLHYFRTYLGKLLYLHIQYQSAIKKTSEKRTILFGTLDKILSIVQTKKSNQTSHSPFIVQINITHWNNIHWCKWIHLIGPNCIIPLSKTNHNQLTHKTGIMSKSFVRYLKKTTTSNLARTTAKRQTKQNKKLVVLNSLEFKKTDVKKVQIYCFARKHVFFLTQSVFNSFTLKYTQQ